MEFELPTFPPPDPPLEMVQPGERTVLVSSPVHFPNWHILNYVQSQADGDWMMGTWPSRSENPYQNERGIWIWLVVK